MAVRYRSLQNTLHVSRIKPNLGAVNSVGFSALPGGLRMPTLHFQFINEICSFWSSSIDTSSQMQIIISRFNDDEKTVAAMDLLVPGVGEIVGGSQREERYDILLDRIREAGLAEEEYSWYMDLRKYGGVKHAGYGLGFERIIMYITGVSNIRDVLPFPRTPKSAEF